MIGALVLVALVLIKEPPMALSHFTGVMRYCILTAGPLYTVSVIVAVQPYGSVTTSVYTPGPTFLILVLSEVYPAGPVQWKVGELYGIRLVLCMDPLLTPGQVVLATTYVVLTCPVCASV